MFIFNAFNNQFCVLAHRHGLKGGEFCQKFVKVPESDTSGPFEIDIMRFVLIALCANGLLNSADTFVRTCMIKNAKSATLWYNNKFCILPPDVSRFIASINRLLHLNSWIFLSYAAFNYSPGLMVPWLAYHSSFLVLYLLKIFLKATLARIEWKDVKVNVLAFKLMAIVFVYFSMEYYEAIRSGSINSMIRI